MATKQLNTRIDEQLHARLERLAALTGRSKTFYAEEFIARGLNDLEDYFLAKDALTEFLDSGEPSIPLNEVEWDTPDEPITG